MQRAVVCGVDEAVAVCVVITRVALSVPVAILLVLVFWLPLSRGTRCLIFDGLNFQTSVGQPTVAAIRGRHGGCHQRSAPWPTLLPFVPGKRIINPIFNYF